MRVKFSPKNIFLLITLLLAAIVCFLTYLIANDRFQTYVTQNYAENTRSYVNSLALEYFDFEKSTSLKNSGDPEQFIESLLHNASITKAELTDANGLIIASSDGRDINTGLLNDSNWQAALGGENQIKEEEDGNLLLHLPLTSKTNDVRGVTVLRMDFPTELLAVREFTNSVLYIVFGASVVFILIAYITMAELEDKMEAKERSIFDQSRAQTEEKQLYEAITASIAEALVVINKDKQIIMLNPEAERLFDCKSSAVEYRSYEKALVFYDENGKKIKKDPIAQGLEKGELVHISSKEEFYLKNQAEKLIPVAVNIAPVAEERSFVKGVAVTIIDISLEKELQKVKDEFVYVVAHELGNPIFALDGYLSLLKGYGKNLNKEGKSVLASATEINRQLSSLVNDLLEVARNETGRLTFDLEKISVSDILAEVIKNSLFKAKEKGVKISSRINHTPKAVGNERKIREVLINLVDNAIKYTPSGKAIHAEVYIHDNKVIVSVADNGIGLSAENQKHLFEKFFRVKSKETEGISGTGLGLFIAKQIVEKCGGKIWAKSEEGKGSAFYVSLKTVK